MRKPISVLIIDDSNCDAQKLIVELRHIGYEPYFERINHLSQLNIILTGRPWDIIFSEYFLKNINILDIIDLIKQKGLDLPLIIYSKSVGEERIAEVMKYGAHDYVVKGKLGRLEKLVDHELLDARLRREKEWAFAQIILAKQEWETVFDAIPYLMIVTDQDGVIIRINKASTRFFESNFQEIIGVEFEHLLQQCVEIGLEDNEINGEIKFRHSHKCFTAIRIPTYFEFKNHGSVIILQEK